MGRIQILSALFAFATKYRINALPFRKSGLAIIVLISLLFGAAAGTPAQQRRENEVKSTVSSTAPPPSDDAARPSVDLTSDDPGERERLLLERIEKLERRLAELERQVNPGSTGESNPSASSKPPFANHPVEIARPGRADSAVETKIEASRSDVRAQDFLRDTTINFYFDGYYGYNFNRPVGRVNLLRAYDVLSNSFSLSQAAIVVERAPNIEEGRRFGLRLDLQYGQATETAQGSAANELRPQAYRPIWQAFGTYVVPAGRGLTLDFGKFASTLGYESNYAKDNFNYSRSYYFNFLPFYHLGLRAKYQINERAAVIYHVVNGAQQSEDFNGFKSQHVALVLAPAKNISWQINYYVGREQRDVAARLNPALPDLPTQPGLSTDIIRPVPDGRLHILDTYATWNATPNLTLAAEADTVVKRVTQGSSPSRVTGGVVYARYQFSTKFALAGRAEYLSDHDGLFSSATQILKETTLTADYRAADGFLIRAEWRRDSSNRPFFLTEETGRLKREQNTATIGLIWWLGQKEGSW